MKMDIRDYKNINMFGGTVHLSIIGAFGKQVTQSTKLSISINYSDLFCIWGAIERDE